MAYDASVTLRAGEKAPLSGSASVASGTLTISGSPTFTLYDASGNVVAAFNGVGVTGYDNTALSLVRVWFNLDTTGLAAGTYEAAFAFSVVSSVDSLTRNERPVVQVVVEAPVDATYDATQLATSALFQARLHAADTNVANPDFTDPELNWFLTQTAQNPELAAARALRALAADAARLAVVTKKGTRGNDESGVYTALMATADKLDAKAIVAPVVVAPAQVFSTDSADGSTIGTMTTW